MEKAIIEQTYETPESNKNNGKIFVILGKSGAGKTSIARDISEEMEIPQRISYTSRNPREGEINGSHYHFVPKETFETDDFVCREQYIVTPNGAQHYGVKLSDLETVENIIIVLTPSGYRELKERFGDRVLGIYIMAPQHDRFQRYISRDPNDQHTVNEAIRRFDADNKDFFEFEYEADIVIINNKEYNKALEDVKIEILIEFF